MFFFNQIANRVNILIYSLHGNFLLWTVAALNHRCCKVSIYCLSISNVETTKSCDNFLSCHKKCPKAQMILTRRLSGLLKVTLPRRKKNAYDVIVSTTCLLTILVWAAAITFIDFLSFITSSFSGFIHCRQK